MNNEKLANAIVKAIGYTENGGKPDINNPKKGKTGEMASIFQFTPATWKNYAQQVLGDKNAPMNADNETYVVHKKVSGWLEKGYTPKQIASMWNAGTGEPDAYSGKFSDGSPSRGVNKKYGVKFDVPGYADKVDKYTNNFVKGEDATAGTLENPNGKITDPTAKSTPPVMDQGNSDPLSSVLSMMKQAQTPKGAQTAQAPQVKPNTGLIQTLINKA